MKMVAAARRGAGGEWRGGGEAGRATSVELLARPLPACVCVCVCACLCGAYGAVGFPTWCGMMHLMCRILKQYGGEGGCRTQPRRVFASAGVGRGRQDGVEAVIGEGAAGVRTRWLDESSESIDRRGVFRIADMARRILRPVGGAARVGRRVCLWCGSIRSRLAAEGAGWRGLTD